MDVNHSEETDFLVVSGIVVFVKVLIFIGFYMFA